MDGRLRVSIVALLFLGLPPSLSATNEMNLLTTVYPMMNQYLPVNSETAVTFNCTVAPGFTVVWSINGTQISYSSQFAHFMTLGYTIEPMSDQSTSSTLTVSVTDEDSVIECLPFRDHILWCQDCSREYSVVTFDAPDAPIDFTLHPSLMLLWTRPSQVPLEVPINYTVEINSTGDDGGGMNFINITSDTSLSVLFLEDMLRGLGSDCVEFEFYLSASNDAGTSASVRVVDTVPISPDVTEVNRELKVETVYLHAETAAVNISFPSVKPCSGRFPITNYTLYIDEEVHRVLVPDNTTEELSLTSQLILPQDGSFFLSLKACSDVTCRTSVSRIINTTDLQSAEVAFFERNLYLKCTFADNSQGRGCIFELVLKDSNITERFNVTQQNGSIHTTSNNQREAYGGVYVRDWEEDGMEGNFTFNITGTVSVLTMAEFIAQTGFDIQDEADDDDGINIARVVIAVPVTFVTLVIVALFILSAAVVWLGKKHLERRKQGEDHDQCVTYEFNLEGTEYNKFLKLISNTSSDSGSGDKGEEKEGKHPRTFRRCKSCDDEIKVPSSQERGPEDKVRCELELDTKVVRLKFHQTAFHRMQSAPASEGSAGKSCRLTMSEELKKLLEEGSALESGEQTITEKPLSHPTGVATPSVPQLKVADTLTHVSGDTSKEEQLKGEKGTPSVTVTVI